MVFVVHKDGTLRFYMDYRNLNTIIDWFPLPWVGDSFDLLANISLGMLVPNSRDWHEKIGYWIFRTSKHTLK